MVKVENALILEADEFRHRGQYRISVSRFPKSFKKNELVKVETRRIDNGERILAIFSQAEHEWEEGVHRVTKRGQLCFTPPKGMIADYEEIEPREKRYKTLKASELDFSEFK